MATVLFVIFAILFLFGLPILITLVSGKIILKIREKKEEKKNEEGTTKS